MIEYLKWLPPILLGSMLGRIGFELWGPWSLALTAALGAFYVLGYFAGRPDA